MLYEQRSTVGVSPPVVAVADAVAAEYLALPDLHNQEI